MSERVFCQGSSQLAFFLFSDVASGKPEPACWLVFHCSLGIHRLLYSFFDFPGSPSGENIWSASGGIFWHLLQKHLPVCGIKHTLTRQFRRGRGSKIKRGVKLLKEVVQKKLNIFTFQIQRSQQRVQAGTTPPERQNGKVHQSVSGGSKPRRSPWHIRAVFRFYDTVLDS